MNELASIPPYPGLRPFTAAEAEVFFGREAQVDQLIERLERHRLVSVVGVSGAGKSSLVRAGLIPALERGFMADAGRRWRQATMLPGDQPLRRLAEALVAVMKPPRAGDEHRLEMTHAALRRGPRSLVELYHEGSFPGGSDLLLFVDQFEEVFAAPREQAERLVALLLATARAELPIYVVLTMRSDFVKECALFPGLPEALSASQFFTPRLTREQLYHAIVLPAALDPARPGSEVEPALADKLLNDMGSDPFRLPLLQHLLLWLWQGEASRVGDGAAVVLRLADYLRIEPAAGSTTGRLGKALEEHAEQALAELDAKGRTLAERVFRCLTRRSPGERDIRRPLPLRELADAVGAEPAEIERVLKPFRRRDRSFVTPAGDRRLELDEKVNLGHESLIWSWPRLARWVEVEARSAETYRYLVQAARRKAEPWRFSELDTAVEWWDHQQPNPVWASLYPDPLEEEAEPSEDFDLADSFLKRSKTEHQRKLADEERNRRRLSALSWGLLALGLLAITVSLFLLWRVSRAQEQLEESNQQLSQSQEELVVTRDQLQERERQLDDKDVILADRDRTLNDQERELEQARSDTETAIGQQRAERAAAEAARREAEEQQRRARTAKAEATTAQAELDETRTQADAAKAQLDEEVARVQQQYERQLEQATFLAGKERFAEARLALELIAPLDASVEPRRLRARRMIEDYVELRGGRPAAPLDPRNLAAFAIALSPSGRRLAAGGAEMAGRPFLGDAFVLDLKQQRLSPLPWPDDAIERTPPPADRPRSDHWIHSVAFVTDDLLATAGAGQLRFWRLGDDGEVEVLPVTLERKTRALAASPKGDLLASATFQVELFDPRTGKRRETLREQPLGALTPRPYRTHFEDVAVALDGSVAAAAKSEVVVWRTGRVIAKHERSGIHRAVAFDPLHANRLATVNDDPAGQVAIYDFEKKQMELVLSGHRAPVLDVAFTPGGALVSASQDHTLRVWDVDSRVVTRVLEGHGSDVVQVETAGDVIVSLDQYGQVLRWEAARNPRVLEFPERLASTRLSASGELAVELADGSIGVHSLLTGYLVCRIPSRGSWKLSPDGSRIAVRDPDREQRFALFDSSTCAPLPEVVLADAGAGDPWGFTGDGQVRAAVHEIEIPEDAVSELAAGRWLWIASRREVALLDLDTAERRSAEPPLGLGLDRGLATTADGRVAVLATGNGLAIFQPGKPGGLDFREVKVSSVFIAPEVFIVEPSGQFLAGLRDNDLTVWDLDAGIELFSFSIPAILPYTRSRFAFDCAPADAGEPGCWLAVPLDDRRLALYDFR